MDGGHLRVTKNLSLIKQESGGYTVETCNYFFLQKNGRWPLDSELLLRVYSHYFSATGRVVSV